MNEHMIQEILLISDKVKEGLKKFASQEKNKYTGLSGKDQIFCHDGFMPIPSCDEDEL